MRTTEGRAPSMSYSSYSLPALGLSRLFDFYALLVYKIQQNSTKIQVTYCVHYRKKLNNPKMFTPNPNIIVRCHDNGDVGNT